LDIWVHLYRWLDHSDQDMTFSPFTTKPVSIELAVDMGVLRGLRWSNGAGVPVLAIHGWLDNAASFAKVAPLLPDLDLVSIDLPGHGHSDHYAPGMHYHFIDYVPVMLAAISRLNWSSCLILGHSLGAAIASCMAAVAPDLVRGLFLIDGLGPYSKDVDLTPDLLRRLIHNSRERPKSATTVYDSLQVMVTARQRAGKIDQEGAELLVSRNAVFVDNVYRWRTDRRLLLPSPQPMTELQVLAFLGAIRAPTTLVVASDGLLKSRPETPNRISAFRAIDVLEIEGGHHLHLDNSQVIAEAVSRFAGNITQQKDVESSPEDHELIVG